MNSSILPIPKTSLPCPGWHHRGNTCGGEWKKLLCQMAVGGQVQVSVVLRARVQTYSCLSCHRHTLSVATPATYSASNSSSVANPSDVTPRIVYLQFSYFPRWGHPASHGGFGVKYIFYVGHRGERYGLDLFYEGFRDAPLMVLSWRARTSY